VAGSSDAPVITPDPLTGIRDAILRRTAAGRAIGPDQRLAARDAVALYTTGSAFAMHRETELGSLEPGKLADFTVLDRNPLSVDPEQITDIQVLATVVDGKPTYQAGGSTFPAGALLLRQRRPRRKRRLARRRRSGTARTSAEVPRQW
jgi:predicted amidohydrolase YtcJ